MLIRFATMDDIPAINQLFYELDTDAINFQPEHFQRGERTNEYLSELINSEKSDFLLAVLDDKVVGFSLVFEKQIGGLSLLVPCKFAYIQDFVVSEEYRNKGIGSQLMEKTKMWAKKHDAAYLRLSVFPNNKSAQRFYVRHGLYEQMISMECLL